MGVFWRVVSKTYNSKYVYWGGMLSVTIKRRGRLDIGLE